MKTSKLRIAVLLCSIVLLSVIVCVLYAYPSLLEYLPWRESPSIPADDPLDDPQDDPISPPVSEPTDPSQGVPADPSVSDPTNPPQEDPADPPAGEPQLPLEPIVTLSGTYYTYAQMSGQLLALGERYSDILSVSSCGTSADGRELYVATLGNPKAQKQIIITAGMHAREYVNCFVVMRQMEYYLENYDTASYGGKTFRELFSKVCLVIAPMTNPDGITMAQEGIDALRADALRENVRQIVRSKTKGDVDAYLNNNWKSNARGVDINRNFDLLWNEYTSSYTSPAFKEYKGVTPDSESETRALVALTEGLSNPVASVCVHSQGNLIYWRCTPGSELWTENLRLAEITRAITGYRIIDENQTDAQTEPSYSNWTVFARGIPTVTVENGLGGYPQRYDMADGFYDRNRDLWAAIALEYAAKP
jgi:g-D-glutamyl-meso-diaminopimelate peptidase